KRKISSVAGANAQLAVNRSGSEPFHGPLHNETRHTGVVAIAALLFIGPAEKQEVVGNIRQTNPHLLAVKHILFAFATGCGSRTDNVRSGPRLGKPIGRQFLAPGLW